MPFLEKALPVLEKVNEALAPAVNVRVSSSGTKAGTGFLDSAPTVRRSPA